MALFTLMVLLIMVTMVGVLAVLIYVVVVSVRQRGAPPSLPSAAPLPLQTVESITQLRGSGRTLEAVKVLRETTGMDLGSARNRVAGWSDVLEFEAARRATEDRPGPSGPAPTPPEQVRIEASAIVAASGWHTAETFLREQRGFTPEAAKALLDSLERPGS